MTEINATPEEFEALFLEKVLQGTGSENSKNIDMKQTLAELNIDFHSQLSYILKKDSENLQVVIGRISLRLIGTDDNSSSVELADEAVETMSVYEGDSMSTKLDNVSWNRVPVIRFLRSYLFLVEFMISLCREEQREELLERIPAGIQVILSELWEGQRVIQLIQKGKPIVRGINQKTHSLNFDETEARNIESTKINKQQKSDSSTFSKTLISPQQQADTSNGKECSIYTNLKEAMENAVTSASTEISQFLLYYVCLLNRVSRWKGDLPFDHLLCTLAFLPADMKALSNVYHTCYKSVITSFNRVEGNSPSGENVDIISHHLIPTALQTIFKKFECIHITRKQGTCGNLDEIEMENDAPEEITQSSSTGALNVVVAKRQRVSQAHVVEEMGDVAESVHECADGDGSIETQECETETPEEALKPNTESGCKFTNRLVDPLISVELLKISDFNEYFRHFNSPSFWGAVKDPKLSLANQSTSNYKSSSAAGRHRNDSPRKPGVAKKVSSGFVNPDSCDFIKSAFSVFEELQVAVSNVRKLLELPSQEIASMTHSHIRPYIIPGASWCDLQYLLTINSRPQNDDDVTGSELPFSSALDQLPVWLSEEFQICLSGIPMTRIAISLILKFHEFSRTSVQEIKDRSDDKSSRRSSRSQTISGSSVGRIESSDQRSSNMNTSPTASREAKRIRPRSPFLRGSGKNRADNHDTSETQRGANRGHEKNINEGSVLEECVYGFTRIAPIGLIDYIGFINNKDSIWREWKIQGCPYWMESNPTSHFIEVTIEHTDSSVLSKQIAVENNTDETVKVKRGHFLCNFSVAGNVHEDSFGRDEEISVNTMDDRTDVCTECNPPGSFFEGRPSLDRYKERIMEDEAPENCIEEDYKMINNIIYSWQMQRVNCNDLTLDEVPGLLTPPRDA